MFVHLHCRSHYSFLRAVASPEELAAAAAEQKMAAVALTDTDGLYAAIPFYQAARERGVKPIVGVVLEIEFRNSQSENPAVENKAQNSARARALVLLAADRAGYSNLCELVTRRQLDEKPVSLELLNTHGQGLIALHAPEEKNAAETAHAAQLKEIFGDALYLEAHHFLSSGRSNLRAALELRRAIGVPLAATNQVHFLRPEEHLHHRVLNAIRTGTLLTQVAAPEIADAEAYFKSEEEMRRAFADYPEALAATTEIAGRADLELELGKTIFPEFPVPEGETPFSYLWQLCFEGARKRYFPLRPEVLARLTHELEVIHRLHLAPYFLLVWEIVEEARRRGIPAVARGSAASSMVTYCLGISRVCPLRWGLYFERFLNEQRGDCPDIDIDICGVRRDELLNYVYERWGQEHVAMIASFITMHARLAVREVAKVFGLSPGEVNQFTRRLPHRPVREILEAIRTLPECRTLPANEEPWKTILAVALRLDNFPRHLGIHPCGTVIAARPLTELVPLERATKGIVVTQYDMNAVEALGLIKMDLLGQRGLTTMSLALANIERSMGERIDFDAIPENDEATCAMTSAGRTMGVFQIESPGLRGLLRALRAKTLEELCVAIAIIRPGASEYGAKETFLRRLRGQEPVHYAHALAEPILRETLGVCVYQEQVMQLALALGSLTLAEADIVRQSKAKFADERERQRLRAKFLKAAERLALEGAAREETWKMVEKFAGFAFCKAHSATYADLAYRIAYLKAHYPAEFLAAMCSAEAGFYHVSAYVEEAKRWGIEVRLPSVNHSRIVYTTEPAGAGRAMRIGLMQVKSLRREAMEVILRSREERGPFCSLEDFLRRVPLERNEAAALIKCGALDDFGETRPALLWRLSVAGLHSTETPAASAALFPETLPHEDKMKAFVPHADYSREQRLACEQEILEVAVSGHPLDLATRDGEAWSTELESLRGRRVQLLGWLITFRHVGTKNYRNMMFATFEDQRGIYEAVLFPNAYDRYGGLVFETRCLRVTGRVEADGQLNCEKLERIEMRQTRGKAPQGQAVASSAGSHACRGKGA
ncbi:MAG: DNA polymerase III subunit alpha [Candidatus Acidiferrales bacterium]